MINGHFDEGYEVLIKIAKYSNKKTLVDNLNKPEYKKALKQNI